MSQQSPHEIAADPADLDRAREYLRSLGLDDPGQRDATIRWALRDADSATGALDAVMRAVHRRIEQLRQTVDPQTSPRQFAALLTLALRRALATDPAALHDAKTDSLNNAVTFASHPVLPETVSQTMVRQTFGKAPPPLRYGFWRRVARRCILFGRGVTNMLRSR